MGRRRSFRLVFLVAAATAALLPLGATASSAEPDAGSIRARGCDPIDPAHCLLPFPNDWYTVFDPRSGTGRRVQLTPGMMPRNVAGVPIDPAELNRNDGFSPGQALLADVPGVDLARSGAAPITDMARSLRHDSPIVIINTRTGQRHPHWAELDANATDPTRRALIVRPARNLDAGARYVVALRNLRDAAGAVIEPSAAFRAVTGPLPPRDPVLRARWVSMLRVRLDLHRAGIGTRGLVLAWAFTVASAQSSTQRVLHMRDEAFRQLGGQAPAVTVTEVVDRSPEQDPHIARAIKGVVEVPSYLDRPGGPPGSRLHYDTTTPGLHTLPTQLPGNLQRVPFACNIPRSAFDSPARPVLFGHGLFGNENAVDGAFVRVAAGEHNTMFCGAAWIGMASEDIPFLLQVTQDFSAFPSVPDRLQQSYLDFLFLGRAIILPGGLAALPAFQDAAGRSLIARQPLSYAGYSLGGIQGAALTAIAQDFRHALLGVPATNFSLLLNRAQPFAIFGQLIDRTYPDRLEQQVILGLAQMLWDRGEGNGYLAHLVNNPLPGTPAHRVLLHEAFGDHQVANVATEVMARTLGLHVHQPALAPGRSPDVTPFWAIPAIPGYPFRGSALVMWDSGSPPPPLENVPPTAGADPHGHPGNTPAARAQAAHFLRTGEVIDVCGGNPCIAIPLP